MTPPFLSSGLFLFLASTATALLCAMVRRYALAHALIDHPGTRSSHQVPTPRGGGLAIATVFFTGLLWLGWRHWLDPSPAWALAAGLAVAWVGWVDDHGHVSPRLRATIHVLAAAWAVACLGGMEFLDLGRVDLTLGWAGSAIAVVAIVWLTNLYNFMDGIDGIAAGEAVFAGCAGGILFWLGGAHGLALVSFLLAAASLGFLFWNWHPARMFMGDVGSSLLGFAFGVLAIAGEVTATVPALVWCILLSVFVWDATFTLLDRVGRGQRWYSAHREHAYQRLVQQGISHARVSAAVLGLNLLVLYPMAWLAWTRQRWMLWLCVASLGLMYALWKMIQGRCRNEDGS